MKDFTDGVTGYWSMAIRLIPWEELDGLTETPLALSQMDPNAK
jgi:hypothetical protein